MQFKGNIGQYVELEVLSYQFPEHTVSQHDQNWLMIRLTLRSTSDLWESTDPSLTTFEVMDLIKWFRDLSLNKQPDCRRMVFSEPNFSFELLNGHKSPVKEFRIHMSFESSPPWADNEGFFMDCHADNVLLETICNGLELELNAFPVRI